MNNNFNDTIKLDVNNKYTAVTVLGMALERYIDAEVEHAEWVRDYYGNDSQQAKMTEQHIEEARRMVRQLVLPVQVKKDQLARPHSAGDKCEQGA